MIKALSIFAAMSVAFCSLMSCEGGADHNDKDSVGDSSTPVFGGSTGNNGTSDDNQTGNDQPENQKIKVGIFGDSISTFQGCMCNADYGHWYPNSQATNLDLKVDRVEETWWHLLINEYLVNAELDVNSSWEGTKVISHYRTGISTGRQLPAGFVDRAKDFKAPDYIFIHGGTNDKNQSTALGGFDYDKSIAQLDSYTFRPAYIKTVKTLQQQYPGVKIVAIIGDMLNGTEYGNSIKEIADHFGIPCVDFRPDYPLAKDAGSHPNAPAFVQMARKIAQTCKDYIPTIYSE